MIAILLVFFVSGAASLVYEVVWMRHLSLVFGVTTYATATILAVFMGGLALGSHWLGRASDRFERKLRVYAALELAIGLYALCVPELFEALRGPTVALYRLDLPYAALALGRAALAALVLLPPTVLMGGTLPVLAAHFIRRRGDVGGQTGRLYFVNTAGAVVGCALAGFVLIEHLGMAGTARVAAFTNFGLALVTLAIDRREGGLAAAVERTPTAAPAPAPLSPGAAQLALVAIAVSGFTALAYEVFWTRALLRYVYNSTYAFAIMLSVFLAGLAIGSALVTRLPGRHGQPLRLFALLELGVGLGFLLSLALFAELPRASALLGGETVGSFGESVQLMGLRAGLILFLPSVCLGATLPLATEVALRGRDAIGRGVGRVYAVNTVGAILGSLAASFLLIPGLGMQTTLLLLVATNLALGGALAAVSFAGAPRLASLAGASALVFAVVLAAPDDVFRRTFTGYRGGELVFYREGATDTVGVVEQNGQRRIVYEDQRGTAATWSYPVGYVFGHLPVLLHSGEPERGLHICFGVGNSLAAMAAHASIREIDNVELSPHALEAAPYFWTNEGILENEKVRTIIDDGRNFVMATNRTYDVVALEPPETFTAGVINLYTREFYQDVRRRLADDGVVVQWIAVGEAPLEEEKMLFRAFFDVFPQATVWQQLTRDGNILMVGSKRPLEIDYQRLRRKMNEPHVRRNLMLSSVHDPVDLLSMFVFGPEDLAAFVKGIEPVTDDRTVLDFSMPRYLGSGFGTGFFRADVKDDGKVPLTVILERTRFYYEARKSVMPWLVNLGDVDPKVLEWQIRRHERPTNREAMRPIPESEWKPWPMGS